jgi:hypothetical protein
VRLPQQYLNIYGTSFELFIGLIALAVEDCEYHQGKKINVRKKSFKINKPPLVRKQFCLLQFRNDYKD